MLQTNRMGCEAAGQHASQPGLIHEPSKVHVQNQAPPFLSNLALLLLFLPSFPGTSLLATPGAQIPPVLHHPARETSRLISLVQPPKHHFCCVPLSRLCASLPSPLQRGRQAVLLSVPTLPGMEKVLKLLACLNGIECLGLVSSYLQTSCFPGEAGRPSAQNLGMQD